MKGKPSYKSEPRNNYGAVDYYEGKHCMRNALAGIKPLYLADNMEIKLNQALENGFMWASERIEVCINQADNEKSALDCIQNIIIKGMYK